MPQRQGEWSAVSSCGQLLQGSPHSRQRVALPELMSLPGVTPPVTVRLQSPGHLRPSCDISEEPFQLQSSHRVDRSCCWVSAPVLPLPSPVSSVLWMLIRRAAQSRLRVCFLGILTSDNTHRNSTMQHHCESILQMRTLRLREVQGGDPRPCTW